MGWYYTDGASRADIIRELVGPREDEHRTAITLRHCAAGNVLWSVNEITIKKDGSKIRYIACHLLHRHKDGWGYKPLDESNAPCYYTCPLAYLVDAPVVADAQWREQVKAYWAKRKLRREAKQALNASRRGAAHA